MAFPFIKPTFSLGEMAPGLMGRVDLQRYGSGCGTLRNWLVKFQGGIFTRPGYKFCGFSKQTERGISTGVFVPPRLIRYQQNIRQGLCLEFGDHYVRVIQNGEYVVEAPIAITSISQTDPAIVTYVMTAGGQSAVPINTNVISSYAPSDTITLAGGTYTSPAILRVTRTLIKSAQVNSPGTGVYAPGDTIALTGGTQVVAAEFTVATTKVVSATVAAAGAAGTPGSATVTGTTGTGTPFQATVTISGGGAVTSVDAITVGGSYTVNPTVPTAEPVTGGGLVGAQLNVKLGVATFTISNAGSFTSNPTGAAFTQASTSGTGTGATFKSALMGVGTVIFSQAGVYTAFPANPVSQASTSGLGLGVQFTVTTGIVPAFADGDWVFLNNVVGMTEVNGEVYTIRFVTPTTFQLYNVYGEPIDSTAFGAYASGGTIERIYTIVSPYAEADLLWLKWTQKANVMTFGCLNQDTNFEYPVYELTRSGDTSWAFTLFSTSTSIIPPVQPTGTTSAVGTTDYNYVVTSVAADGSESLPSGIVNIPLAVDINATAGSNTIDWMPASLAKNYNVYKAQPGYAGTAVPIGAQFGFAGQAFGTRFIDSNIVPDMAQTPPRHQDPFVRGAVLSIDPTASGTGYTNMTLTINTSTGSGASVAAGVVNGGLAYVVIVTPGSNYRDTDTITITGDGSGAAAVLRVSPITGTYPSVPAYWQQRRFFANSLNEPDTYWGSQPGAYRNFDVRIPTIDSDAITGTPWAVEVNGIQFMIPMPGGLMVLTGLEAWLVGGNGSSALIPQPITPASQQATPQAFNGCHNHVMPVKIDQDVIYVQAKGSNVRNIAYNISPNIYTGIDLTLNSSHMFLGYQIQQLAWCEEPFKILWSVRDDGTLLSFTFLRLQEVQGWARHDTAGLFVSVCSVTELPVDALYVAVQRNFGEHTAYTIERQNDRIWTTIEDAWCVDCGLALAQPEPAATLTASSATGAGIVSGGSVVDGGQNYSSSTYATIIDDNGAGPGTGATVSAISISGGVITGFTVSPGGANYTYPAVAFFDPEGTGSGATATLTLDNTATFEASTGVFSTGDVGSVIRMGGGRATITGFTSATEVTANIDSPIIRLIPNTGGTPQPALSGEWTLTAPVTSVRATHLAGALVTGIYDGKILPETLVPADGVISLPEPASQVVIGLGYVCQMQTARIDPTGGATTQGQRKVNPQVTLRIEQSRDLLVGTNQQDGSNLSPPQTEVAWPQMKDVPNLGRAPFGSDVKPLFTGDVNTATMGGFAVEGQIAVEQRNPVPAAILACIPDVLPGDLTELKAPDKSGNVDQ